MHSEAERQLPQGDEIFLDHVGHFVADRERAAAALTRAGFAPTPSSIQVNPDPAGGAPQPTGTGNVTAMLSRGYIECLFKTADTPLGQEFDAALARYPGVHLAAFAIAEPEPAHARLASAGFRLRPIVQMQRPVSTPEGLDVAAFTVVRLEPRQMPEGRIQMLAHRTERTVWQPRWLDHPNGALGLSELLVVSDNVGEAAGRFARFTGRPARPLRDGQTLQLHRGRITIVAPGAYAAWFPDIKIPATPFLGAYTVRVRSLTVLKAILQQGGIRGRRSGAAVIAPFPDAVGVGAWVFSEGTEALPWRP